MLCLRACPPLALGAPLGSLPAQNSKPSMGSGPHTRNIKAPKKEGSSLGQPAHGSRELSVLLLPGEIESQRSAGPSPPPHPGAFLLRRRRRSRRRKAQLLEACSWEALGERASLQGLGVGCGAGSPWASILSPTLSPAPSALRWPGAQSCIWWLPMSPSGESASEPRV